MTLLHSWRRAKRDGVNPARAELGTKAKLRGCRRSLKPGKHWETKNGKGNLSHEDAPRYFLLFPSSGHALSSPYVPGRHSHGDTKSWPTGNIFVVRCVASCFSHRNRCAYTKRDHGLTRRRDIAKKESKQSQHRKVKRKQDQDEDDLTLVIQNVYTC